MVTLGHESWHRPTVGLVERAQRTLAVDELLSLAAALQTTVSFLLSPRSVWDDPRDPESIAIDVGGPEPLNAEQIRDLYGFGFDPFPQTNRYYDWPETVWKEAEERYPRLSSFRPASAVNEEDE